MDTKETLTSVLDKQNVKVWTGLNWLGTDQTTDFYEMTDEPSGSINAREFLTELKDQLMSKNSEPWSYYM